MFLARTGPGVRVAALFATVAILLGPGTFWYHYLAMLLPFAAMAWPAAGSRMRVMLFVAAVDVSIAVISGPITLVAAAVLVALLFYELWPRTSETTAGPEATGSALPAS
jgi:hypothetical protein